jgi:hypothetical protein
MDVVDVLSLVTRLVDVERFVEGVQIPVKELVGECNHEKNKIEFIKL